MVVGEGGKRTEEKGIEKREGRTSNNRKEKEGN